MLLDYFPRDKYPEARRSQELAINAIDAAIQSNTRFIVVDAPTGSGKSFIAMTLGRWSQDTFIVTPTKALQQQYKNDFPEVKVMSGRRAYPCTYGDHEENERVIKIIRSDKSLSPPQDEKKSCAKGKCVGLTSKKRDEVLDECAEFGHCPYNEAIDVASMSPIMVQNLHSFFFQTSLFGRFKKRRVLIIDEAHDLDIFLRDQITTKIIVGRPVETKEINGLITIQDWVKWFRQDEQYNTISKDNQEKYLSRIERMDKFGEKAFAEPVISKIETDGKRTKFEFIPSYVGSIFHEFVAANADIVVFMSGTIFDPKMFLAPLGISIADAAYIRIDSDFPPENRPVVLPRNTNLDLSHKGWSKNIGVAVKEIQYILDHHKGQKGLIHVTSYSMAREIQEKMPKEKRLLFHEPHSFQNTLNFFFASKDDYVLISPSIQQGIDAYGDRARFQILIRPQNMPTTDPWVESIIRSGRWDIYFYKSLVVFAQQLGRPVRSNTDTATTYLLSSTYKQFLDKTKKWMPEWLRQGFVK